MTLPLSNEQIETLRNTLMAYDLSLQPEKLNGRPLFIWHGKQDDVVPFDYTYAFYKQIEPFHQPLMMLVDEHAGHKVTREAFYKRFNGLSHIYRRANNNKWKIAVD